MTVYVTITDAEAAAVWRAILGQSERVPILYPDPVMGNLPEIGPTFVYQLDVAQLDNQQRSRLIDYIADRFRLPVNEVADGLDDPRHGVPIRASTCFLPARPQNA